MTGIRGLIAIAAFNLVIGIGLTIQGLAQSNKPATVSMAKSLRPVSSFAGIADKRTRSLALFSEAAKVMRHPRCSNCHPGSDRPLQGDKQRPHRPLVVRGKDNLGAPGMVCATCHGPANFDPAGIPGSPHWQLAPSVTGLKGKSTGAICQQLKDPKRNGGKDIAAILKHVGTDKLVIWAWNPGRGRMPAPGSHAEFLTLMKAWAATGAHCQTP